MSTLAIICEYNPFHNGHLYHLEQARQLSGSDHVLGMMSGSMVQRGEPAVFDKWSRTRMALACGMDLVCELPAIHATGSARRFAQGAVRLLSASGVVSHLAFGVETSRPAELKQLAEILSYPPPSWEEDVKNGVTHGLSYPSARLKATQKYLETAGYAQLASASVSLMQSPNNILALEYLIALQHLGSGIEPVLIPRLGEGYHSEVPSSLPSATLVRHLLRDPRQFSLLTTMLPPAVLEIIREQTARGRGPVYADHLDLVLLYTLRRLSLSQLKNLADMEPGLAYRIKKAAVSSGTRVQLRERVKSKRHTMTRIDRILLYSLLNISGQDVAFFDSRSPNYLRILGCSSSGRKILQEIRSQSEIWIINRVKPALEKMQNKAHPGLRSLELDIAATDLQALLFPNPVERQAGQDFTTSPLAF